MFIGNLDVLSGENIRKMFEGHGAQVDVINKSLAGVNEKSCCDWCSNPAITDDKFCERCQSYYEKHEFDV